MAFFTSLRTDIPVLPKDLEEDISDDDEDETTEGDSSDEILAKPGKQVQDAEPVNPDDNKKQEISPVKLTIKSDLKTRPDSQVGATKKLATTVIINANKSEDKVNKPSDNATNPEPSDTRFTYEIDPDIGVIV